MKTVCQVNQCTGCMACVELCPKNAINIKDDLVSYNAVIDNTKCVECRACIKICQVNTPPILKEPIYWKQGWAKKSNIRELSSSGGFATALELELEFVKNFGSVCSCEFKNGKFLFSFAETEEEVKKFTGSKYVKSNPYGIYKIIKKKILNGEKLLFVGLPCQVGAVINYVGEHDNLYTVDLICHGTPSPFVLDRFLSSYNYKLTEIKDISFRTKNDFHLEGNRHIFAVPVNTDYYTRLFLDSVSYTENCYKCNYAQLKRVSDITLGDSWGSEEDEETQKAGISLALCQTEKGKMLLEHSDLRLLDVDLKRAIEYNHQLRHPSCMPNERERFLKELKKEKNFKKVMRKCYPKVYYKNIVKTILYKCKIYRGGGII